MKSNFKKGAFITAAIFHLAILALMFFGVLFKPAEKLPPMIFEMVSPPSTGELPDFSESSEISFTPQEIEVIPVQEPEPIPEQAVIPIPPKKPTYHRKSQPHHLKRNSN